MERAGQLFIGDLAERAGVHRETLRYYERRGLLSPTGRTPSGYRVYDEGSLARLLFIKRAQAFGFSLEEIRHLLEMQPEDPDNCHQVMAMLDGKLEELARRIEEMRRFREQLEGYRKQCAVALDEGGCCPVIVTVSSGERETEKNGHSA